METRVEESNTNDDHFLAVFTLARFSSQRLTHQD